MSVVFLQGAILVRGDLDVFITNSAGNPSNVSSISYALYFVDPVSSVEVLIGPSARTPVNPSVGEYYAALQVPSSASPGDYRIRWLFRETAISSEEGAVQEFGVVSSSVAITTSAHSTCVLDLIHKMRTLTRDNCIGGESEIEVDVDGEIVRLSLEQLYYMISDITPSFLIGDL